MTLIARIDEPMANANANAELRVFVGDELACVATPISISNDERPTTDDRYYFLTVQSDRLGKLRIEVSPRNSFGKAGSPISAV